MWGVVGGTQVLQYTAAGVLVPNGRTLTANGGISATTLSTSGAATLASASVTGNLSVGGTLTLTGGLTLNGNVTVGDASTDTLTINSTITSNLIFTDNTYDIGASGATRPRHLYLAGNGVIGGTLGVSGVLTASGGVTGNLTGNVTGNVTGNISGGTVAGTTGAFSSNVTVGGTLGVTGAATLSNTLAVTGAITATGGVLGNVTGDLTGNVTGNISGGTVAGSTGAFSSNVTVGGTLGVTGGSTLNGGVVINELGADADTRIEGDTDANLFFVDASADSVGIGTNTPSVPFEVKKTGVVAAGNWYNIAKIYDASGNKGLQLGYDNTSQTTILAASTTGTASNMEIYTFDGSSWAARLTVNSAGNLGMHGESGVFMSKTREADVARFSRTNASDISYDVQHANFQLLLKALATHSSTMAVKP
jgi:trimeric autotransporter adhesin